MRPAPCAAPLCSHSQGSAEAGAFKNCFGDANAFVRRAAFERVGGYTEDFGVGFEDWEVGTHTGGSACALASAFSAGASAWPHCLPN